MKLTKAQIDILKQAEIFGRVDAYMQQRRAVEKLSGLGLLEKIGLVQYKITDAGRATLVSSKDRGGE